MVVEICANSIASAINAEKAGADRIELCAELGIGGITPSHGMITEVMQKVSIPVHVLIRPRSGDFTYSDAEIEIMKKDIQFCKKIGCTGVVTGVLHSDFTLNKEHTAILFNAAEGMHLTFHRAFDWVKNPMDTLEHLIDLKCNTILSSGQANSAIVGIELLIQLKDIAKNRCTIMPGGGINKNNVHHFKESDFEAIHCSATTLQQKMLVPPTISMNSKKFLDETMLATSNEELIAAIISKFKA